MYVICVCPLCLLSSCALVTHTRLFVLFTRHSFVLAFILEWAFCIFLCTLHCIAFVCFAAQQTRSINAHVHTSDHSHRHSQLQLRLIFSGIYPKLRTHWTKHVNRLEHNNDTHLFLNGFFNARFSILLFKHFPFFFLLRKWFFVGGPFKWPKTHVSTF